MRRALLIWNPASGQRKKGRTVRAVTGALEDAGWVVSSKPTREHGHATLLAAEATVSDPPDAVFALGGDGTFREVAKGLLGSRVPLGLLPGGTANVLAHALGIPGSPLDAVKALSAGRCEPFDVGLAGGEPFLMMVSAGMDALVVANTSSRLKRYLGKAAMAWQFILEWWRYPYSVRRLEVRGEDIDEARGSLAVVCNIPFYGGPHRMAPDASWQDGKLDLVVFSGSSRTATLGLGRDLLLGRHQNRPDVLIRQAAQAVIHGPPSLRFQLDGDPMACDPPLEIGVSPHQVRVLVP